MDFPRLFEQMKKPRLDSHGFARRARVEARDLAGGGIEIKLTVQPFNFIEGFLTRRAQRHRVFAVEHDFEPRCHGLASEGDGLREAHRSAR